MDGIAAGKNNEKLRRRGKIIKKERKKEKIV